MEQELLFFNASRFAVIRSKVEIEKIFLARSSPQLGDIYLGLVNKFVLNLNASFIQLNTDSRINGFLHSNDLGALKLKSKTRISELLKLNQRIIVQVIKEATKTKGPRLTTNLFFTGRYLIFFPFASGINFSSNIEGELDLSRIEKSVKEILFNSGDLVLTTSGYVFSIGLFIRPSALNISDFVLKNEYSFLKNYWLSIQKKLLKCSQPQLIAHDFSFLYRVIRDLDFSQVTKIFTDSESTSRRMNFFFRAWGVEILLKKDIAHSFIESNHSFTSESVLLSSLLKHVLQPLVRLPSGGSIIINITDAFTVIDVNSGSFFQIENLRTSIMQINLEAAKEIAFQLRLRNLSGAIVIDFIDMLLVSDQIRLLNYFTLCLSFDEANPEIIQMSELGFVEITRHRKGNNLYELALPVYKKYKIYQDSSFLFPF